MQTIQKTDAWIEENIHKLCRNASYVERQQLKEHYNRVAEKMLIDRRAKLRKKKLAEVNE